MTILHIDSSARHDDSISRAVSARVVAKIGGDVIRRDVAKGEPVLTESWVNANFTPADDRTDAQREVLGASDVLVNELMSADTIVIGAPIYNFGLPATLKLWIDLIARANLTFRYTSNGPEGLLKGKRAILVLASGGVPIGSELDFATPLLVQVMNFIGITEVTTIAATGRGDDEEAARAEIDAQIEALLS
ncbi:NAD(P)H-dependent oxidoreductase [uncultured Litoreibacter sp.]|uniref:FMN-dependent NADH-azoreductase n=1 Tax=uncultured Litoreibacter sp. TaxID=1392394 RepID=UPI00263106EA|nr:NAD(P)H-dependent oxidoreductase [uncultured Litoreibacter sp.]